MWSTKPARKLFAWTEHEKLVDRTPPKDTVSFKFFTRFKETLNIFMIFVKTFLPGLTWKPTTQRSQRDGLCTVRARWLLKILTLTRINRCSDLECWNGRWDKPYVCVCVFASVTGKLVVFLSSAMNGPRPKRWTSSSEIQEVVAECNYLWG